MGVLFATPPSINVRPPQLTGGKTPGIAPLAGTAPTAGPEDRRSSAPLARSVAITCSGTLACSRSSNSSHQRAQPMVGHQVVSPANEAKESRREVRNREDVPLAEPAPRVGQQVDGLDRGGRDAMNPPLNAPTEVATIMSGAMPRSYSARSIPTSIAQWLAPPDSTNATGPLLVPFTPTTWSPPFLPT